MPIRRWIPLTDIVFFIGLFGVSLASTVGVLLTVQEWDATKTIAVALTPTLFLFFTSIFFTQRWMQKPNYIAEIQGIDYESGIAVWTNGVNISKKEMEAIIDFFITAFSQLSGIEKHRIAIALEDSSLELRLDKVKTLSQEWVIEGMEGIQKGKGVIVHWNSSVKNSALFHEWIHMVDEFVNRNVDYKHSGPWWRLESELLVKFPSKFD
jgi:hypothetical protein